MNDIEFFSPAPPYAQPIYGFKSAEPYTSAKEEPSTFLICVSVAIAQAIILLAMHLMFPHAFAGGAAPGFGNPTWENDGAQFIP